MDDYWRTVGKWCGALVLSGIVWVAAKPNPSDYFMPALYGWAILFPCVLLVVGLTRFLSRRKRGQNADQ